MLVSRVSIFLAQDETLRFGYTHNRFHHFSADGIELCAQVQQGDLACLSGVRQIKTTV